MTQRAVRALLVVALVCAALPVALVTVTATQAGADTTMISSGVNHTCGADVTSAVQNFLQAANSPGDVRQLQPDGCYRMDSGALSFTAVNKGLTFDLNGATIKDTTEDVQCGGTGTSQEPCNHSGFIKINHPNGTPGDNIASGMTIMGPGTLRQDDAFGDTKCESKGLDSRHCFEHGIEFLGMNSGSNVNVKVRDLTIDRVHGDCLYLQKGTNYDFKNVTCNRAGRQGVGDVGGTGHYYDDVTFTGVHRTCFDFEPNSSESTSNMKNVVIKNSTFAGCGNGAVNANGYNPYIDHIWFVNNTIGTGGGININRDNCETSDAGRRNQWYFIGNTITPGSDRSGIYLCGVDNANDATTPANGSLFDNNTISGTSPIKLRNAGKASGRQITIQNNTFPNATAAYNAAGGLTQLPFLCKNRLNGGSPTPSNCTLRAVPPAPLPGGGVSTPSAPTVGTATAGNGSATVAFSPPASNGGAAITSYRVTSTPGGVTKTGTGSPITVTGLNNGTAYTFKVQAINSAGAGTLSAASNSVTPSGGTSVPSAPTIGTATPGDKSAVVRWTAPASNGGSAINAYIVYRGSTTANPVSYTSGAYLALTVVNLTNGTPYQFTVRAQNAVGLGPASALSNSVTPTGGGASVPDAPTIGTAAAGDASATVAWTAGDDNGAAITGFKVTSSPATTTKTVSGATATSTVFTGLSNGTAYTFTVKATNSVGDSVSSSASNSVTPVSGTDPPVVPCDLMVFTDAPGLRSVQVERAQNEMIKTCRALRSLITGSYSSATPVCNNITVDPTGFAGVDPDAASLLQQGLRATCQGMRGLAPVSGSTTSVPNTAPHGDCDAIKFASQTGMDANRRLRALEGMRNACDAFRRIVTEDYDDVTQGPACNNATVDAPTASTPTISQFAAAVAQVGWRQACEGAGGLNPDTPTQACEAIVFATVAGVPSDQTDLAESTMRDACEAARNISITNYNSGQLGPVCANIHIVVTSDTSAVQAARLQHALRDACRAARNLVDNATGATPEECDSLVLTLPDGYTQDDYDAALAAMQQACENAIGGG